MSNRILDGGGDSFTDGATPFGSWVIGVRSAFAGTPRFPSVLPPASLHNAALLEEFPPEFLL